MLIVGVVLLYLSLFVKQYGHYFLAIKLHALLDLISTWLMIGIMLVSSFIINNTISSRVSVNLYMPFFYQH